MRSFVLTLLAALAGLLALSRPAVAAAPSTLHTTTVIQAQDSATADKDDTDDDDGDDDGGKGGEGGW